MIVFKTKISNDDNDRLMAATMIANSSKDIIFNILTIPDINISTERFKEYINDYTDKYMYSEFLKNEVAKKYIQKNKTVKNWTIDFNSQIMTIEYEE